MADVKLEARVREGRGGKDARALREAGEIPGVIYTSSSGKDGATPICVVARGAHRPRKRSAALFPQAHL